MMPPPRLVDDAANFWERTVFVYFVYMMCFSIFEVHQSVFGGPGPGLLVQWPINVHTARFL